MSDTDNKNEEIEKYNIQGTNDIIDLDEKQPIDKRKIGMITGIIVIVAAVVTCITIIIVNNSKKEQKVDNVIETKDSETVNISMNNTEDSSDDKVTVIDSDGNESVITTDKINVVDGEDMRDRIDYDDDDSDEYKLRQVLIGYPEFEDYYDLWKDSMSFDDIYASYQEKIAKEELNKDGNNEALLDGDSIIKLDTPLQLVAFTDDGCLYSGAGTSFKIVCYINDGTKIIADYETAYGFYHVKTENGEEGFLYKYNTMTPDEYAQIARDNIVQLEDYLRYDGSAELIDNGECYITDDGTMVDYSGYVLDANGNRIVTGTHDIQL